LESPGAAASGGTLTRRLRVGAGCVRLLAGDITRTPCDAMVNAADSRLAGGGGVDGAIHRAGGPSIMAELARARPTGGCPAGRAVVTGAGNLPARWIVHAVGPVWRGGGRGEETLLRSAYRESLRLAAELGAAVVALPSISTGAYGYPVDLAAPVALRTVADTLAGGGCPVREAVFVLYNAAALAAYEEALSSLALEIKNS
jgi:O-acetyl-ADP-ribose deacetylase